MIILHFGKGTNEFKFLAPFLVGEQLNDVLFTASKLLASRGDSESVQLLVTLDFKLSKGANDFNDEFLVLHTSLPVEAYEYLHTEQKKANESQEAYFEFQKPYLAIANIMKEIGYFVRFIVFEIDESRAPDNWQSDFNNSTVNNQALFTFNDGSKIPFEGLNFRSKTEVKIYEALLRKGLLVMPLPVVAMGIREKYKEPDFVVCYKGKMGILEIHGGQYHPPEAAAKEHERRREFLKLGVSLYEIFDSTRCWQDPDGVVDDFLQAFAQLG